MRASHLMIASVLASGCAEPISNALFHQDQEFLDALPAAERHRVLSPDEETAAKVSLISLSNGAFAAESWTAIPYKRFLKLTEEIS